MSLISRNKRIQAHEKKVLSTAPGDQKSIFVKKMMVRRCKMREG